MSDTIAEVPVSTGLATSPEIGELAKALATAHKDFKPVKKDAENPYFKSKYADLANVIEATSDALSKNGLALIQSPRLVNSRIAVTTLLAHSSGQWVRDELELPLAKFDAQGAGSAITYARRYAYQSIVGVAAEADDDGNAANPQTFKKQEDGSFAKNPPPRTENVQKPSPAPKVGRPKKDEPVKSKATDFPFGQNAPALPSEPVVGTMPAVGIPEVGANIHGVKITDEDVPFPCDDEKDRPPTEAERKEFMARLITLKQKGHQNMREWLLKQAGVAITNDIGFNKMTELVAQLEAAEKAGTLKELLSN